MRRLASTSVIIATTTGLISVQADSRVGSGGWRGRRRRRDAAGLSRSRQSGLPTGQRFSLAYVRHDGVPVFVVVASLRTGGPPPKRAANMAPKRLLCTAIGRAFRTRELTVRS